MRTNWYFLVNMFEIMAGVVAGVLLGALSGLIPGIHANTMAGILMGASPVLFPLTGPYMLAAALFSTLITHTFVDIIPATYFGLPDPDTALAVLPAHELCIEGRAEEAIRLSALGGLWGLLFAIPLSVLALFCIQSLQPFLDWGIGLILIAVMGLLIVLSQAPFFAFSLFFVSGALGIFAFTYEPLSWHLPGSSILMPLLTGLFGVSVLMVSSAGPIPVQRYSGLSFPAKTTIMSAVPGTIAGIVVGWLPGLSNASANALLSAVFPIGNEKRRYLVATGAANTANAVLGLAVLYAISRQRNGIMVILASIEIPPFFTLLFAGALAGLCAYVVTILLSGTSGLFSGHDARKISLFVIGFVFVLCAILTGPFGLFILILAILVGLIPYLVQIPHIYCIGCITVPVILYSFDLLG